MNLQMIKANNLLAGNNWFSPDTMRFFKSRVLPTIYGGRFFLSRETSPSGKTAYSVREAVDGGKSIKTRGEFHAYSLEAARGFARALAANDVVVIARFEKVKEAV